MRLINWSLVLAVLVLASLIAFIFSINFVMARDLGQWTTTDQSIRHWYESLMQPDNPAVSCCGEADAYFCSETYENGHVVCVIDDDRDDKKLRREHIDNGTRIEIPDNKLKYDQGNPTGHAVVFLSSAHYVWCFVRGGGV